MRRHFRDAALEVHVPLDNEADVSDYADGAFTSIKPDIYYFAKPRGTQWDSNAWEEWHFQEGRREVLDYIFFDAEALKLQETAKVLNIDVGSTLRTSGEEPT